MDHQNYEILQVSENATDEEIRLSYERLKAKYNEEKWQDGEAGNQAARMLGKLDAAYQEIMEERKESGKTSGADSFEEVSAAIRSGDIGRAQKLLDDFNERTAEWHYLQSVVFYKKNWMNESKKQLEIAIQMDGANSKYREAYEKLKTRADYQHHSGGSPNAQPNANDTNRGDEQMGGDACTSLCYTCACMQCLYSCCSCR